MAHRVFEGQKIVPHRALSVIICLSRPARFCRQLRLKAHALLVAFALERDHARLSKLLRFFALRSHACGADFGGVLYALGYGDVAAYVFAGGTALVRASLIVIIIRSLMRGAVGLDIVAAISMAGSLALGEWVAGNVVALMFTGGQVLEAFAQARAKT